MGEGHFHHVPILDNGRVIGVLSSDDVPEEYRMLLERFKEIRGG
jgi:signal-transduction protein with cAMP-binding, CBS, and nucleotidyltransferase domain